MHNEEKWLPLAAVPERVRLLLALDVPAQRMLAFTQLVRLLKTQPRTGWVDRGVPRPLTESIADHMYRMAVIAMALPRAKVDVDRCVKIAVVHDMAELLVGDITPFGGVSKPEKHRREYETMQLLQLIVAPYNAEFADELMDLWLDYEEIRSVEAQYVKDIDKLEMIQQAWDYEQDFGRKYDLEEFYQSRLMIKTAEIGALCDAILEQRHKWAAGH